MSTAYDWISSKDVVEALKIEQKSYPADEAATLESFRFRQSHAGDLFLGAYANGAATRELIAYVCSTLSPSSSLTHESMSNHVPSSSSVCIHSVCVSPAHRRKGVGLDLLKEYISRLEAAQKQGRSYKQILLITHENLRHFYESAGFKWLGRSEVVHGSSPWYEMRKILGPDSLPPPDTTTAPLTSTEAGKLPAGLLEALKRPSNDRSISRLLSSFPNGIADVLSADSKDGQISTNKFDLLCPRPGCGSVILKRGVGQYFERPSVQMEPVDRATDSILPTLPPPPQLTQWWLITPSPMQFENIGFSRPVQHVSSPKMKLLACAECDLGPLGWSEEGGTEFWLACTRVGY